MQKIKPLRDRILVRIIKQELSDIIIVPDSVKIPTLKGEVVSVGDGYRYLMKSAGNKKQLRKKVPLTVKVGDQIMFQSRSVDHTDDDHALIQEADVLFIIEDSQQNQKVA